jgi:two-component system chemotaxis sensor kinase CheA
MTNLEIFDSLQEAVFVIDATTQVLYCNEAAALLANLPVRRILRSQARLEDVIFFDKPPTWISTVDQIKQSTTYQELSFTNISGAAGRVQISIQPLDLTPSMDSPMVPSTTPPVPPRWLIYFRDISLEETLQKKYRDELEQKEGFIFELQRAQQKLVNYSKNLESMVQERTHEIKELNVQMKALLDSLSEGFLIFNEAGDCLSVFSQACLNTLEKSPLYQKIWDVLALTPDETILFKKWQVALFGQMLPFEDLKQLGPSNYKHSKGRTIALDYFPLMNSTSFVNDKLNAVVMVATDISELVEAQKLVEKEKVSAQLILSLVQKQAEIGRFLTEAQKLLKSIHQVASSEKWMENQEALLRWIHTLKGGSGSFTIPDLGQQCHHAETLLVQLKSNSPPQHESLALATNLIQESVDNFVKEARQILGPRAFSSEPYVSVKMSDLQHWAVQFSLWSKGVATSDYINRTYIYAPLESLLAPYQHLLEKLAESQQKQIAPLEQQTHGLAVAEDVYSSLFASFVHIFRNLIDHGIESPDERVLKGKPAAGRVEIKATLEAVDGVERLVLCISDDGRGIDAKKIRNKLKSMNIDTSLEEDQQVIQHVFDAQVSTREELTELSGRGVGLDAVKFEVTRLGGRIWVTSHLGLGTHFWIELPWSGQSQRTLIAA